MIHEFTLENWLEGNGLTESDLVIDKEELICIKAKEEEGEEVKLVSIPSALQTPANLKSVLDSEWLTKEKRIAEAEDADRSEVEQLEDEDLGEITD